MLSLHRAAVTTSMTTSQPSDLKAAKMQNRMESDIKESGSSITTDTVLLDEHAEVPEDRLHGGLPSSQKDGEAQAGAEDYVYEEYDENGNPIEAHDKSSGGMTVAQIFSIVCPVIFLLVCSQISLYLRRQVKAQKLVLHKVMPFQKPAPLPKLAFMTSDGSPPDMPDPATAPAPVPMPGSLPHLLTQRVPNEGNTKWMSNNPQLLKTNRYLAQSTLETLPGSLPSGCSIEDMGELV